LRKIKALVGKGFEFFLVLFYASVQDHLFDLGIIGVCGVFFVQVFDLFTKQSVAQNGVSLFQIPFRPIFRNVDCFHDDFCDNFGVHFNDLFVYVHAVQNLVTLFVYKFTLTVQNIVVFKSMSARVEVITLDPLLDTFKQPRKHTTLNVVHFEKS